MKSSYLTAAVIAAAATLWVASGMLFSSDAEIELSAAEQAALNAPTELQRVQVLRSQAQPRIREITVSGRTEASRAVTMRAETEGTVTELLVQRGTPVLKGEPLIRLAPEDRPARVTEAEALVAKRELEFRAAEDLSKKSFTSEVALANAKAELESARANLEAARLEFARITIRAPFDGVFNRNHVEVGNYVRVGDDIADMVDLDPLLLVVELAELSVGEVRTGVAAKAQLIDGRPVDGLVTFVSTMASPETRTFTVEVSVENADMALVDGMTATVRLPAQEVMAHRVPPAALTLDDNGAVGIKYVDANGQVVFAEASASASTTESVWLTGLPASIDVITIGQEFVSEGQEVQPVLGNPGQVGSLAPSSRTRLAMEGAQQ